MALADKFIIFDQVQYLPYDWINRNKIKTAAGPIWLSVPVLHREHFNSRICDIKIDNARPWARKHWKSIQFAYSKAPHFKTYADFFEHTYLNCLWDKLVDLNYHLLLWFLKELDIRVSVERAGEYVFQGSKSNLVLDMCVKLEAKVFIFGALGRQYADIGSFERAGVTAIFQNYHHPVYPQQFGEFASHISIIDLLFNCGHSSKDILMSGNVCRADVLANLCMK